MVLSRSWDRVKQLRQCHCVSPGLKLKDSKYKDNELVDDGMIIGLLNQGFSEIEVRSVLKGLGGYCFTRVKKEINVPELKE